MAKLINKYHVLPMSWAKVGTRKGMVSVLKILKLLSFMEIKRMIAKYWHKCTGIQNAMWYPELDLGTKGGH